MQQQQNKRPRLSPPELIAILLCLLYSCVFGYYFFLATATEDLFLKAMTALLVVPSFFPALAILLRARRLASVFQWLTALLWLLLSLCGLGIMVSCLGGEQRELFWLPLILGAVAALFAALHIFLARQLHQCDD